MARATLDEVAREARVSRQTVSNVLNAPDRVAPATRDRVMEVVTRLDYRPNRAARTLRTGRSHLLGVRMEAPVDGTLRGVLDRFLHRLTSDAQTHDYRVVLFPASPDEAEIKTYTALLEDHDLDALILTGIRMNDPRTQWLAERRIPFVTFGRPWGHQPAHHAWVDVDGAMGTRLATEHLIGLGHRRIAYLGWPADSGIGDDRHEGWSSACRAAGLDVERLGLHLFDSLDAGRRAFAGLLDGAGLPDSAGPPTAVVCASDSLAVGAWTEITSRGLRPGADIGVVGFDDSPTAAVIGLTSVAQPVDEVVQACLRLVGDVLGRAGRTAPIQPPRLGEPAIQAPPVEPAGATGGVPASVLLPPRLVVRASTSAGSAG